MYDYQRGGWLGDKQCLSSSNSSGLPAEGRCPYGGERCRRSFCPHEHRCIVCEQWSCERCKLLRGDGEDVAWSWGKGETNGLHPWKGHRFSAWKSKAIGNIYLIWKPNLSMEGEISLHLVAFRGGCWDSMMVYVLAPKNFQMSLLVEVHNSPTPLSEESKTLHEPFALFFLPKIFIQRSTCWNHFLVSLSFNPPLEDWFPLGFFPFRNLRAFKVWQLVQQWPPSGLIFVDFDRTLCTTKAGASPLQGNHSLDSDLALLCRSREHQVLIVTRSSRSEDIVVFLKEHGALESKGSWGF